MDNKYSHRDYPFSNFSINLKNSIEILSGTIKAGMSLIKVKHFKRFTMVLETDYLSSVVRTTCMQLDQLDDIKICIANLFGITAYIFSTSFTGTKCSY